MSFKLGGDGVHFWSSSPTVTKEAPGEACPGSIDEAQAEHLRRVLEVRDARQGTAPGSPIPRRR